MQSSINKKALKSGLWYTLGNFLLKGIGFLTTPIFTRIMSQEDIGYFSNYTTWVGILVILFTFDLHSSFAVARFDFENEFEDYIASNLLLSTLITFLFFGVVLVFEEKLLNLIGITSIELKVALVYILTYPAIQMFQTKCQLQYNYKISVGISILNAILSTIFAIIAVLNMENQIFGRIIGYYLPTVIIGFFLYVSLIKRIRRVRLTYWKYAILISLPLVAHLLAGFVLSSSDRVMINSICGSADLALYSVAYSCAMLISILMTSLNSAWSPWLLMQIDKNQLEIVQDVTKSYLGVFGIMAFGFMIVAPEILFIMGGNSYVKAIEVIPPIMLGIIFQFVYTLYVNVEQYYKRQIVVAIGTVIAAGVNIVLNLLFIPIFGYIAAAYTTLVCYAVLFLLHYIFVHIIQKAYFYDNRYVLLYLALCIIFTIIISISYAMIFLRIILALFLGISCIFFFLKKKGLIKKLLSKKK